jgi:superfamily II DNA or RNA helicase
MESSSSVHGLSFRKNLRSGQRQVFEAIKPETTKLNVKLPTGYGKTFVGCGTYSILKHQGRVNRMLVIFPTVTQITQFKNDGHVEFSDALVDGPLSIDDVSFFGAEAIKHHRSGKTQIFVTTIQALGNSRGMDNCRTLLQTGQWLVWIDEYHHYGIEKQWGLSALSLPRAFLLATSATPTRPKRDSAFGEPDISVSYRAAVKETAVKPLHGHAYNYKLDAIMEDGNIQSFTTAELAKEAGGSEPERIEKLRIKRKMRWSPKYVSPLIRNPIERMQLERCHHGNLQMLVGAMCVSHAELVCQQIKGMFPELKVEWVGTGENGRPEEVNKDIVKRFCPEKDASGRRGVPQLNVLVHVGIAGEGLDSTLVSEVIHLNNASLCNRRNQEAGRASRYLEGVVGHINFDSSSEYAPYTGESIMDAMDEEPPQPEEGDPKDEPLRELPDEPYIQILNLELLSIDSGDRGVQRFLKVIETASVGGIDYKILKADLGHPEWEKIIDLYRKMRQHEADEFNQESRVTQWQEAVHAAVTAVTGRVIRMMVRNGVNIERSLAGDIKKRINTAKKRLFGEVRPDIEICRQHYHWLKQLEQEIIATGLPSWLS